MTAASELVKAGFRENNIIPVGKDPTTAEQTEGLGLLNRDLNSVYGFVVGENLTDWPIPAVQRTGSVAANPPLLPGSKQPLVSLNNSYPAANVRLVWDGSTRTVYFPESPEDGARMALVKASGAAASGTGTLTLDGNGRTIEGSNTYTAGVSGSKWMYRADLADWKALADLALADDCPFPPELDDFWICGLAIRLAPRYGKEVASATVARFRHMKSEIQARYWQNAPATSGGELLQPGYQSYAQGWFDLE